MNQPVFLQLVEKLEGFLGKLPASIQKPVLQELTPLKELFLKQRAPRLVLTGAHKFPVQEVVSALFAAAPPEELRDILMEVHRWQTIEVGGRGHISLLDARGADAAATRKIEEELERTPADLFLHLVDGSTARPAPARDLDLLVALSSFRRATGDSAKVIGISLLGAKADVPMHQGEPSSARVKARLKLEAALTEKLGQPEQAVTVLELSLLPPPAGQENREAIRLMSLLSRILPNEARIEIIRISRDREAQEQIAQTLVKSTSAICTAIGAQPIPLADLPILTGLQLGMVSGIMYIAGREKSFRAATEFIGALGVNVGAGMVLREGARVVLKFFPGWGNVVCGMVAGAGTYALGRAAIVYFLEGVTLKDARRTYAALRKKRPASPRALPAAQPTAPEHRG